MATSKTDGAMVGRVAMASWTSLSRSLLPGFVALPALMTVFWFGATGLEQIPVGRAVDDATRINLSEAIALKNRGAAFMLLETGANPNQRYLVRAEIIMGYAVSVTPLQATMFTREIDLFELLANYGARMTGEESRFLYCLALDVGARELSEAILRTAGTSGESFECQPEAAVDRIRAQRVERGEPTGRSESPSREIAPD